MHMEGGGAAGKAEGTYKSHKTKTMVAVEVADEDVGELGEAAVDTPYLHLGAFGAVHQKHFTTQLHHLGGGVVASGGLGTAAT